MLNNRLILTLLVDDGILVNSHRFQIQRVSNIETTQQYLNFEAIDELVVLDVGRGDREIESFASHVRELSRRCFVPVAAGGGVRSLEDVRRLLVSGADKVVINTAAEEDRSLVGTIKEAYGSQCVVVSIDGMRTTEGWEVMTHNGTHPTGMSVIGWARQVEAMGAGEIYLTSINEDGAGQGYDLELLESVSTSVGVPVIASGGVGRCQDLVDGVVQGRVTAVSLANLFHFTGYHGLGTAKRCLETMREEGERSFWLFH